MDYKKIVRAIISNRRLTLVQQINSIKQNVTAGDYKEALKISPIFNKYLKKDPFFYKIDDLRPKEPFQFTSDFKKEYRWLVNIVENFLEEINAFIKLKNEFEHYLILGKYQQAKEILINIESNFGVSLWSIEANIMLEDLLNGTEANWNKLSHYLKEIKNSIYEFNINSSSKRVESKLTYDSFLNQFQNDLDSINASGLIKDYLVFKNFSFVNYEYEYPNLESALYVSNIFSVVDQYLLLVDIIIYNISFKIEFDKTFLGFISKAKEVVIDDYRIANIYNVINDKNECIKLNNSDEVLTCLNLYYSGKFSDALEQSKALISTMPLEFELYIIYCKCLINLSIEYKSLNISPFIDDILIDTYNLLSFKKENQDCFKKLLKHGLFFVNTNIGKQIFGLLSDVSGENSRHYITGFLSSSYNSQKNTLLTLNRNTMSVNFLELYSQHCFKVSHFKLANEVAFSDNISTSHTQEIIFNAIRSFNKGNYANVIEILNSATELNDINYYFERKITLLYYSYLKLSQIKDALLLFGNIYFNDLIISRKLDYLDLYEKIKRISQKDEFVSTIEYPILYSLNAKEYDLYEVYDEFLSSIGIFHIKELKINEFVDKYTLKKAVYFLNTIATIDTLKYSTDYDSVSDVEEDRVYILQTLILIDSINKLVYEKEIDEIYRINSVRKVLKEVDEGRLYIAVDNLKELQVKKFNDDFKRYKEIEFSASSQSLIGFNPSNIKNWDKALTEKNEVVEYYNSADYLAFKSIYLESRDNFLFSKEYGLDSCLSTRIRHGALKNHIRSVFEKLDLVTSKSKDRYKDNEVWKNQLVNHIDFNIQVQSRLKTLSKQIDDYTVFIVDKLIQIQTEKISGKSEGLFTFFTNDETLFKFYNQNKHLFISIESTIDIILTSLTNRTLVDIQFDVVKHFTENIKKQFQKFIEEAITDLRSLNLPQELQLVPFLIKSNTDIQNELEEISNWFYLNTTNSSSLLNVRTVVDASIESMNRINPNYRINPQINLNCEPFAVYSSLFFVFNILFNNIIEHCKLNFADVNIQIDFDIIEEKYIRLKITNNLNDYYSYNTNIETLNKIKENWNNHSRIDRSNKEGESGFDKIKRILLYETFSKTDRFDFNIENNMISIHLFFPYVKFDQNG